MTHRERDAAAVRLPPPLVFLGATVFGVGIDHFVFRLALPFVGPTRLLLALGSLVPAIALMAAALGLFRKIDQDPKPWKPTPAIVTTGVYAVTRNPMYVSMALIQVFLAVSTRSGWALALLPASLVIVYVSAIRHEEAYLEQKFGEEYLAYKRAVRRWI